MYSYCMCSMTHDRTIKTVMSLLPSCQGARRLGESDCGASIYTTGHRYGTYYVMRRNFVQMQLSVKPARHTGTSTATATVTSNGNAADLSLFSIGLATRGANPCRSMRTTSTQRRTHRSPSPNELPSRVGTTLPARSTHSPPRARFAQSTFDTFAFSTLATSSDSSGISTSSNRPPSFSRYSVSLRASLATSNQYFFLDTQGRIYVCSVGRSALFRSAMICKRRQSHWDVQSYATRLLLDPPPQRRLVRNNRPHPPPRALAHLLAAIDGPRADALARGVTLGEEPLTVGGSEGLVVD